ncbi:hypothetical protein GGS21DRAFT_542842 [Xylaria nigripes]|nr:hypothetical protein GGS21DRAFT_542842 [Xylaria nigripes]
MVDTSSKKYRYLLLTSPRTASNLLVRMLNLDEQGVRPAYNGGYFFIRNFSKQLGIFAKPAQDWTPEDVAGGNTVEKECFNALQDHIEAAEAAGEKVFVKEHMFFLNSIYTQWESRLGTPVKEGRPAGTVEPMRGHTDVTQSALNLTCLPDEFLRTWQPTFLIRHPALMIPSLHRTALEGPAIRGQKRVGLEPIDFEVDTTYTRALYDFYLDYFGEGSQWPIVLDADDIMTHHEIVAKYAELVGLDPNKIRFSWEKVNMEAYSLSEKLMLSFINTSTSVDEAKIAGNIDIDVEAVKWRVEFGEEGGRKVERWVREAMPDYEYMRSRRLTPD